jgi:hypothetical protein
MVFCLNWLVADIRGPFFPVSLILFLQSLGVVCFNFPSYVSGVSILLVYTPYYKQNTDTTYVTSIGSTAQPES